MTQPKIFISYRQADNRPFVLRIRDWLIQRYGRDNVFMDFDNLPPFVRFEDYIKEHIAKVDAVIMIVGDKWLEMLRQKEADEDRDFVRIELQTAMQQRKPVLPICINNAPFPARRDMPPDLKPLCDINAAILSDGRSFYDEIERTIHAMEQALHFTPPPPPPAQTYQPAHANTASNYHVSPTPPAVSREVLQDLLKRAREASTAQKYDESLILCNQILQFDPNYAEAYAQRAVNYYYTWKSNEAVEDCDRAIALNPVDNFSYNVRAWAYYQLGKYANAISDATISLGIKQSANTYWLRGIIYEADKRYQNAIDDFQRYIDLNGDSAAGSIADARKKITELQKKLK